MTIDELKQQKIWFDWQYETRDGNRTKVPYSAYHEPYGVCKGTRPESC